MRLSAPKKTTFYVAVVLALVALVAQFDVFLGGYEFWLAFAAFVILAAGNYLKGF